MNNAATPVEALFERAENYSKTSLELFKLMAIDKCADLVSSLAVQFALFMVAAVFTLVINIGIAMWLGDLLGRMYLGFFCGRPILCSGDRAPFHLSTRVD